MVHTCSSCAAEFQSKNALFRHLRDASTCGAGADVQAQACGDNANGDADGGKSGRAHRIFARLFVDWRPVSFSRLHHALPTGSPVDILSFCTKLCRLGVQLTFGRVALRFVDREPSRH